MKEKVNNMDYTIVREYLDKVITIYEDNEYAEVSEASYKIACMISEIVSDDTIDEASKEVPFDILNIMVYGAYSERFNASYIPVDGRIYILLPGEDYTSQYAAYQYAFPVEDAKDAPAYSRYMRGNIEYNMSTIIGKYRVIYELDYLMTAYIFIIDNKTHEVIGKRAFYAHEIQSDNFSNTDDYKELSKVITEEELEQIKSWIFLNNISNNFIDTEIIQTAVKPLAEAMGI